MPRYLLIHEIATPASNNHRKDRSTIHNREDECEFKLVFLVGSSEENAYDKRDKNRHRKRERGRTTSHSLCHSAIIIIIPSLLRFNVSLVVIAVHVSGRVT